MKAIVYRRYGSPDGLKLEEVEKPSPQEGEVLIKIKAASINGSDWEGLRGKPFYARFGGLFRPGNPILGSDVAGVIEATGANAGDFQPGDEVFGELQSYKGGFAEYACTTEKLLVRKPPEISFEAAAAIPQGGVIALQGIRDVVQPGHKVLINGAGGSAGPFAIQLAKLYGAEVTGVDNAGKLDFLRSLGADHVIDYRQVDFTKNGKQYDLILDVIAHRPVSAVQRALKPNGTYSFVGGSTAIIFQILLLGPGIRRRTGKNIHVLAVRRGRKDLEFLLKLIEEGKIVPVIDRIYSLEEVPKALRHVGEGQAKGKVVIRVGD